MTSGVVETGCDLSDAAWSRRPIAITMREVRALVDRHGAVYIARMAEPYLDVGHTGLPARGLPEGLAPRTQPQALSLLDAQRVDDALDLPEMRLFMVCQPLGIRLHGSFPRLADPCHQRRP